MQCVELLTERSQVFANLGDHIELSFYQRLHFLRIELLIGGLRVVGDDLEAVDSLTGGKALRGLAKAAGLHVARGVAGRWLHAIYGM